jgi:hypothetical protein
MGAMSFDNLHSIGMYLGSYDLLAPSDPEEGAILQCTKRDLFSFSDFFFLTTLHHQINAEAGALTLFTPERSWPPNPNDQFSSI